MMEIRKATAQDLQELRGLQKDFYGEWLDQYHADLDAAVSSGRVWVACDGGGIMGYQLCERFGSDQKNFPNSIFLSELYVVPKERERGIGSQLIKAALSASWPPEFGYFSLTHDPDEVHLTAFYEKFGFSVTGTTSAGNIMMTLLRTLETSAVRTASTM